MSRSPRHGRSGIPDPLVGGVDGVEGIVDEALDTLRQTSGRATHDQPAAIETAPVGNAVHRAHEKLGLLDRYLICSCGSVFRFISGASPDGPEDVEVVADYELANVINLAFSYSRTLSEVEELLGNTYASVREAVIKARPQR